MIHGTVSPIRGFVHVTDRGCTSPVDPCVPAFCGGLIDEHKAGGSVCNGLNPPIRFDNDGYEISYDTFVMTCYDMLMDCLLSVNQLYIYI